MSNVKRYKVWLEEAGGFVEVVRATDFDETARGLAACQQALAFWHPGVPEHFSPDEEEYKRAAVDALLLICAAHDKEPSAVDLGWIEWRR